MLNEEQTEALVEQFKKWAQMSVERNMPWVRTIQAVKLLCQRFLQDMEYGKRWKVLLEATREISDSVVELRMMWIERVDGTKWLYFCEAEPPAKRQCAKCSRRVYCLAHPDRYRKE